MDISDTKQRIIALFEQQVNSDRKIHNAHLLVHSDLNQLHLNLAGGSAKTSIDNSVQVGQPVFMASVGKLFTAVLIGMLCEQGMLSFEYRIIDILDPNLLCRLHVYKGKDYTDQIRLKHLLNHTSGLPDYFEDKPLKGTRMIEKILNEPQHLYQPREVVIWSRENLKPKFSPGKGFHYSDTGYQLLGLVIEAATGVPFHDALNRLIFEPLEMKQTYLLGHSLPSETSPYPIAGVYFGTADIIGYRSLGVDYAGGGITAPLEDLLKFMQALAQGKLLSEPTFLKMDDCISFAPGIDYGYGMIKIRPVPLLMPAKYSCWGNAGLTGAFMFYHPGLDTVMIGSLNQFRYQKKGIQFMLRIINALYKEMA
ncbi:MAG: beta-lactamase family protein [Anaerolineaceae bacterium]|nr:beta-lactamase family protein [Anaerolineaceae bacterium]